jgi:hypothetical protein
VRCIAWLPGQGRQVVDDTLLRDTGMRDMMRHGALQGLGWALLALEASACVRNALSESGIGPDLDATVEARVVATLTAILPPEDAYWPTIEDHNIVILPKFVGTGATKAVGTRLIDAFDQYAATYVASECLAGEQLTSERFRNFVASTMGYQSEEKLAVFAHNAIQKLISKSEARFKSGLSSAEEICEHPYLYPATGAEVTLAVGLNKALTTGCIPLHLQDAHASVVERRAAQWFIAEDKSESLLAALGGTSGGCLPPLSAIAVPLVTSYPSNS